MTSGAVEASILPVAGVRAFPLVPEGDGVRLYHPRTGKPIDLDTATPEDLEALAQTIAVYRGLAAEALRLVTERIEQLDPQRPGGS